MVPQMLQTKATFDCFIKKDIAGYCTYC